jgi:hypothetical protein
MVVVLTVRFDGDCLENQRIMASTESGSMNSSQWQNNEVNWLNGVSVMERMVSRPE